MLLIIAATLSLGYSGISLAAEPQTKDWQTIVNSSRGETVYFNAWGGSQEVNQYLRWASKEIKSRYGITLKHVKVADISETVHRLSAEKVAGKNSQGSVDLVWMNGEHFYSLKHQHLLFGPFVDQLPNWQFVDQTLPVTEDFTEPTENLEAPWGVGQLTFIYDHEQLTMPPNSFVELLNYAQINKGKISYPQPPEFHGSSFLKMALIDLTENPDTLYQPVDIDSFQKVTKPLWHYLDQLHQVAWREGKQFPQSSPQMIQLLDDGELDLAITFNPNAAEAAINSGNLVESAKSYAFSSGSLTNIHFLAIPWNSSAPDAAQVVINFLMSPEAQARKAESRYWGDPSVLKKSAFSDKQPQFKLFKSIPEPHPSWQAAIEVEWLKRYGK
ncbi:ABC transporter substrate-binding protein [Vibrio sp. SS-MA-C1-2]|uniref:ABC transporter substrate-binding protein n=1 Tax=Vibrio sp. SS-MA-C1-2 TaxID=2908646 RepID=UPI001F1A3887|nr:ABC transporter substrate-binding protein [Vibrio sp. SS-MA-C1-2]UJF20164.1 ABC transporter substrate-binding protein [Vibrio sp. SS-MA-C1-2]